MTVDTKLYRAYLKERRAISGAFSAPNTRRIPGDHTGQTIIPHEGTRSWFYGHLTPAVDAIRAVRVRQEAEQLGLTVEWEYDDDPSFAMEDHDDWCPDGRRDKAGYTDERGYRNRWMDRLRARREGTDLRNRKQFTGKYIGSRTYGYRQVDHEHMVEGVIVRDADGGTHDSCWGYVDPDKSPYYRDSAEVDVLAEAIYGIRKIEAQLRAEREKIDSEALDIITIGAA